MKYTVLVGWKDTDRGKHVYSMIGRSRIEALAEANLALDAGLNQTDHSILVPVERIEYVTIDVEK